MFAKLHTMVRQLPWLQAGISLGYLRQAEGPQAWAAQPFRSAFVCIYVLCTGCATGTAALVAWHAFWLASGQVCLLCRGAFRPSGMKQSCYHLCSC